MPAATVPARDAKNAKAPCPGFRAPSHVTLGKSRGKLIVDRAALV